MKSRHLRDRAAECLSAGRTIIYLCVDALHKEKAKQDIVYKLRVEGRTVIHDMGYWRIPDHPGWIRFLSQEDGTNCEHANVLIVERHQSIRPDVLADAMYIPVTTGGFPALFLHDDAEPEGVRCECGAAAIGMKRGQPGHSSWCPWRVR